jgi:hypothetical protein
MMAKSSLSPVSTDHLVKASNFRKSQDARNVELARNAASE